MAELDHACGLPHWAQAALLEGRCATPHDHLGTHHAIDAPDDVVVRALHPDAERAWLCPAGTGDSFALSRLNRAGLFALRLPAQCVAQGYRLRFEFVGGGSLERGDPYRHLPTLGEQDRYLFNEGRHLRLWEVLGAHARVHGGEAGVAFAVWAPNAERVSVVGDFCSWDGRSFPMRALGNSGIFELFVPGLEPGALYQYEIRTRAGDVFKKADPMAAWAELPPGRASRVASAAAYAWGDGQFMRSRRLRDPRREPMSVYELHPGSWQRDQAGQALSYRALADRLVLHLAHYGFTHVELMPICEHPFEGSWGYQVTGFYAPTSRYGTPDDFRYFVDRCHQHGIGVILDWVPAHFPRDAFALARFDGTPLYEHADPRRGEHPDWGTYIFNFGRHEVRNFLIASALYWLQEFHIDGLRVDAVASMLYLDYSRQDGEWVPNAEGGREDREAVRFMQELNGAIASQAPGCVCIAEESTAWSGVTKPVAEGGLGFSFKWNMGWMHDTLGYFSRDPIHRSHHQNDLTFSMVYEYSEHFLMPLSHDEVVHGKGSLLSRMPGDAFQRFANLRALLTYQYTRPGKQLLFMGTELAPEHEWYYAAALPRTGPGDELRAGLSRFVASLGRVYLDQSVLFETDPEPERFEWIDHADHSQSVLSYARSSEEALLIVVLNLTPVVRRGYRIGAPRPGHYRCVLNSDSPSFGGSGVGRDALTTEAHWMHGRPQSLVLDLPPLSALVLAHEPQEEVTRLRLTADRLGIYRSFHSIDGTRYDTTDGTRRALVSALARAEPGVRPWISPSRVISAGHALAQVLPVDLPMGSGADLAYELRLEGRAGLVRQRDGVYRDAVGPVRVPLVDESLPVGDYRIRARLRLSPGSASECLREEVQQLCIVPERAYGVADALGSRTRGRGVWLQLYSVRSDRNLGTGDLEDLRRIVRWAGELGLDFVGINPLHAPSLPEHPVSPYFPSSRLFANPLCLALDAMPELADCAPARQLLMQAKQQGLVARQQAAERIDYRAVWELLCPLLERLAAHFFERRRAPTDRWAAYEAFLEREGEALTLFATFCALQQHLREPDWRAWPAVYRTPDSPKVKEFAALHPGAIDFHRYLQFELDRQLGEVAAEARAAGLGLGLYLDLAVGCSHAGADAWAYPALLPRGVNLGAPADAFAPQGQDWGLAPLSPTASARDGHRYLRALLRSGMRHAGALRIDHVMGLSRQFWIPDDEQLPGTYVSMPREDLLGLVAAESQRARCVVIGEDLGTVEDGLREALSERGVLRYQVLCFELEVPDSDISKQVAPDSLATVTTHDLPPFEGLWNGTDLNQRRRLGLLDDQALARARQQRERLKTRWLGQLRRLGLLGPDEGPDLRTSRILDATHQLLVGTEAALVAFSLADLLGEEQVVNLPGTTADDGFESWTLRYGRRLEELVDDAELGERLPRLP